MSLVVVSNRVALSLACMLPVEQVSDFHQRSNCLAINIQGLNITSAQAKNATVTTSVIQTMFNHKTINALAFTAYLTENNIVPQFPVPDGEVLPCLFARGDCLTSAPSLCIIVALKSISFPFVNVVSERQMSVSPPRCDC